jgi:hypothetical protein
MHSNLRTFNLVFLLLVNTFISAQVLTLFDPQTMYDSDGGLFDPTFLREIHINFEDDDYHNILSNSFFTNPSYRIPASVTLDGTTLDSVGVRYKGNSTFCLPYEQNNVKVPYNLDMNYWISGQRLMGYKKMKLANAWLDPTFCKEYIASRIYRKYLPTPEINLIALHSQGNYTGLYVNTESINKQFLDKHFGENDGVLFKCDGAGVFCDINGDGTEGGIPSLAYMGLDSTSYYDSYTIKSDHGWGELMQLISALEFNPEAIQNVINMDRVLWAMAVNTVTNNLDTYNGYYVHNYYLYQDIEGRFQMIPWDLDNTFGGAILGFSFWSPNDVYHFDPFWGGWDNSDYRPLTDFIYNHPTYKKQFIAHIRTVMEESMNLDEIEQDIAELQSISYAFASDDANRLFGMEYFSSNVQEAFWLNWGFAGILSTIEARMAFLSSHAEINTPAPIIGNVSIINGIAHVTAYDVDEVHLRWTTNSIASNFQSLMMVDDGTQGDELASDGIFSIPMPNNDGADIKFYIRAVNSEAMSLSPARAEYEYYIYGNPNSIHAPDFYTTTNDIEWEIYPNPASDSFTIKNCPQHTTVQILDFQGREIWNDIWDGHSVDVSEFSSGFYLVKVNLSGNQLTQKLLVR